MEWTKEQRKTIETTGSSILVSAAAGSGKTTVLVERIKNLLINKGADIDRFLITTFTNAAAAEMRVRLDKALRDELKKPDADKAMLTRQLSKLPSASIGTFHSFALDIIRQYFYLIDIEPGFTIADDVQIEIMKQNAVDNLFSRRYEENTEEFREFILKYAAGKTDSRLRENLLETCRTLSSIHNGIEWALAKASKLGADDPVMEIGGYRYFAGLILEGLGTSFAGYEKLAALCNTYGLQASCDAAGENAEKVAELAEKAKAALACPEEDLRERIEGLRTELFSFKPKSMAYKKDGADTETQDYLTAVRKEAQDPIAGIKNAVYGRSFDELNEELKSISGDTVYYIGLIRDYYEELKALKEEDNVIEFDDALHYAIDILEHQEAADELRDRFEYIFVDEYQDSNYLQEEIIERIARDDNLFMVGDIKQCIYKFRLAEPELFRKRAGVFGADGTPGMLLNISSNFRSKQNVTDSVNCIFREVMPYYDKDAELHCTAGEEHTGFPTRIHLIVNEKFDDDAPDKNDAEGAVVSRIIRERLGTEVFDSKEQRMRPLTLRDFAVIVRNNKEVEDLERYLINEGIAAYGESGGSYFETVEVQVFINLLRIIENMRQDVPLISAMRSVVFGFSIRELAQIRMEFRQGSYSEAVLAYAFDGTDDQLREKICSMIRTIDIWKEISRTVPLEDLMKEILYGTGYYDYCSGLPVGTQRISNLRLIVDKASKYEEISHGGLYGFLRYIESMQSADKTDSEAKTLGEGEDVVRVMSVHKSKGLEFPVVIFANAAKQAEKADRSGRIKIHRDHGIGLPIVNRQEHWHRTSLLQQMIVASSQSEMVEEEIRILYVALTRAKDGLEIVGTIKNMEKLEGGVSTKTFLEMLYEPLTDRSNTEVLVYDNAEELEQSHQIRMHTPDQLRSAAAQFHNEELENLTDARLSFEYPYTSGAALKPKYSVSELNKGISEPEAIAGVESFAPDAAVQGAAAFAQGTAVQGTLSAAERGTLMHLLMEKTDFAKAAGADGRQQVLETADRLLADGVISAEEYDSLSIDKAASFFSSEIGQRAAAAAEEGRLRKEKEFIFSMDAAEIAGAGGGASAGAGESEGVGAGESTIVQGIIDCFFEEEGRIVLIDYKNSYMGAGRTIEDIAASYAGQIDLYRKALEGATGKQVKEAYLYLFDTGEFVPMS